MTDLFSFSKEWEELIYTIVFVLATIIFYQLMMWNNTINKSKNISKITIKSNNFKYWILIICSTISAFVCFLRFLSNL